MNTVASTKYTMCIVKGALADPIALARFVPKEIEKLENPNWEALIEAELTRDEIKNVQRNMVRHYEDSTPWYMDGFETKNHDKILVAFGADDGEGGKIFMFDRNDHAAFKDVVQYAKSKGILEEQMDFLEQ